MKPVTRRLSTLFASSATALVVLSGLVANAQTFTFDVINDTILLNNGGNGQAEFNFGGRNEIIVARNGANPREMLLRFDPSAAVAAIMDPSLIVVDATLILNPRDGRESLHATAIDVDLGVYGLVSQNEGWVEGDGEGGAGSMMGRLGQVSRLYLATPSNQTQAGGPVDDGQRWFSAGGGPTTAEIPTQFNFAIDTTNVLLGSASTTTVDTSGGDADWNIALNGEFLDPFLDEWLAAPLMDDGDGGMQTSNAGLVIQQISAGNGSQWFFESLQSGLPDEIAQLSVTFGPAPTPGDVNDSGFANQADFEIIRQNFLQPFADRTDGDLVNNDFIDFADYAQWRHAPQMPDPAALSAGQIPEPSAALLALAAAAFGVCWLRR